MLSFCLEGESGLSREGSDQQEVTGSHPSHIWGCTAADLHPHAQRLLPTIPQLLCLQITGAGGVALLVWVIDPHLFLSFSPSHLSPSCSLHNHSRRKYSFFSCHHSRIVIFVFCSVHVPLSFLRESHISSEPAQTETGRHRVENAVFIFPILYFLPSFQHQLLIFIAIFFLFFQANMLHYLYLLTSLVEESWEGLCNNIHWSGMTDLLLSLHPDLSTVSVLWLALWGEGSRGDWWHRKREGQHFFQVLNK